MFSHLPLQYYNKSLGENRKFHTTYSSSLLNSSQLQLKKCSQLDSWLLLRPHPSDVVIEPQRIETCHWRGGSSGKQINMLYIALCTVKIIKIIQYNMYI